MNPSLSAQEAYEALASYTLLHADPSFIHQHIVDAFAAQHADEKTRPITLTFALVGLYLCVEQGYSGKQVQRTHRQLAQVKRKWPPLPLPARRGVVLVFDVLDADPGAARDQMIKRWCASVWQAYEHVRAQIVELVQAEQRRAARR